MDDYTRFCQDVERCLACPLAKNRRQVVICRGNPKAKLVCIDIAPYGTTQAQTREDVLNVGGFSDAVFDQIAAFANGQTGSDHWVGEIEKIDV